MNIRVYYEDTDCGGVVYYANYLKYFERARTNYLEERDLSVVDLLNQGIEFRITHAEVRYRSAAKYGDTLTIHTTLSADRRISIKFLSSYSRTHQPTLDRGRFGHPRHS